MTKFDLPIAVALALAACGGETDNGAAAAGGAGGSAGGSGAGLGATGGAAGSAGSVGPGIPPSGGAGSGGIPSCGGVGTGGTGAATCTGVGDALLSVCKQRAEAFHAHGCDGQSAMDYCVILFGLGKCTTEVKAWAECIPGCMDGPSACVKESAALTQCLGCWPEQPPYLLSNSTGSDGSCHSATFIDGFPGPFVAAECAPTSGGQLACTCSIDATEVGSCQGAPGSHWSACELYVGCCSEFWQCFGPPKPPVNIVCGYGIDNACSCTLTGSMIGCANPDSPTPDCPLPITTDCKPGSGGEFLCTCSVGGAEVGTCTAGSGQTCTEPAKSTDIPASDPFFGCCSQFW